jgi:predicted dehydrogenase
VGVATTRTETARAAARRFGARHAFDDARALIAHDDVEAVTVAVKARDHHAPVRAALEAGILPFAAGRRDREWLPDAR